MDSARRRIILFLSGLFALTVIAPLRAKAQPSPQGSTVCPDPTLVPDPPQITATAVPSTNGMGQISLIWNAIPGAKFYTVYPEATQIMDYHSVGNVIGVPVTGGPYTYPGTTTAAVISDLSLFHPFTFRISAASFVQGIQCDSVAVSRSNRVIPIAAPDVGVWGFADTHTHQFADRAFAGELVIGKAFGDPAHAFDGDYVGHGASLALPTHKTGGYPMFDGWPTWNIQSHQQMYEDWLYRSFLGGLRLIVVLGVNNNTLCLAMQPLGGVLPQACRDMDNVDQQLSGAREMEAYLNQTCSGDPSASMLGNGLPRCPAPGMGWYHVVTTAEDARATINRGQLAVVLGIEVDRLFGCALPAPDGTLQGDPRTYAGGDHICSPDDLKQSLQKYYDMGVRHIFPSHLANTAFGGMAIYDGPISWNFNSHFLNGAWIDAGSDACSDPGIAYDFNKSSVEANVFGVLNGLGFVGNPPHYDGTGHCNRMGLTDLGKILISEMMSHHMIIDIDHMSMRTINDTFALTSPKKYPVIAGHTGFLGVANSPIKQNEAMKTDAELAYIKSTGGLVAAGLNAGAKEDSRQDQSNKVANDCSNSTKTFVQGYLYAVSHMGGNTDAAVAVATDQPLNSWLGPRFDGGQGLAPPFASIRGCDGDGRADTGASVVYPFQVLNPGYRISLNRAQTFGRTWDFNMDGMAQIGMYPDLIQDLLVVGLTEQDLQPLYRSAERYIEMWQRAEHNIDPAVWSVINAGLLSDE
jgi:microsomal dipeptidase-like Zn-dependent dipeptidase